MSDEGNWEDPGKIIEIPRNPVPLLSGKAGQILGHLGRDEPVFIFRAQDILSTMVIKQYLSLVEIYNPNNLLLESIIDSMNEFIAWQQQNPEKVKLPD